MRCPSCRHDNHADAHFCEECGEQLRVSGQACPGCGTINSPGARFCVGCGSSLPSAEAPPVSPPPTPPEPVPRKIRTSALIRVFLSQTDILIEPGQRGELSVTVQNLSEIVDQYLVEVEALDTTWYTVSPPNVSLFPQDRGEVKLSLHPSSGAKAGRYDFSVRVTSRENPIDWTRVQATLEVLPVSFFQMTLSPQRSSIVGAEAAFQLQLNNPGNVDLPLSLSATDPEQGCTYLFQPQRLTVEAGRSRQVPLTVRPKERPSEQTRRYDFTIKAVPADAPHKAREVRGQLESKPLVISFELGVSPETQSTGGRGTFSVQLMNLGNAEIALDLSATDAEAACSYRFQPQRVTLAAGGSGEVPLVVTPRRRPPPGETKSYDFTIKATPADAPQLAQTTTGRLDVLRRKRSRALVAVAVGVPLLALLACAIWAWPGPAPQAVYPSTPTRRPEEPAPTEVEQGGPAREAFGPWSGSLRHVDDGFIKEYPADVSLIDFYAHAIFFNPYPSTQGSWDYGLLCRYVRSGTFHQIYVTSDGTWIHRVRIGGDSSLLANGDLDGLRTGADQSNTVEIVVVGDDGEFYVNGELVAILDMSLLTEAGDVRAVTGIGKGNEIEGEVTRFEDFIVEALD
jgi:uncharacterized membrane protein